MQVSGANHTPKISQFRMAFAVSSGAQTIHPNPSATYTIYLKRRVTRESKDGAARDRGRPRRIARVAARGKLRTDVMDITVEAKQRFIDLISDDRGATRVVWGNEGRAMTAAKGTMKAVNKSIGESVLEGGVRVCHAFKI